MSFRAWLGVLLFFHVLAPLGFLYLPEASMVFKHGLMIYAITHGLFHFTSQINSR